MKFITRFFLIIPISLALIFSSCANETIEDDPPSGGKQGFVGSDACMSCHSDKHNMWVNSGHPYKFSIIENGVQPTYPDEAVNFQDTWMENLGDGSHNWENVAGVIGGYGWKARFVGTDGHIMGTANSAFSTGMGHNQFNFYGGEDHGWVDYHPGDEKIYNYSCFKCHTTGGDTEGTWLAVREIA